MLKQLHVQNFALIEDATIFLENGFTVITGETGSGKSILLGALKLTLGERADYSVIRNKEQKTIVEATFVVKKEEWFTFFAEHDLDFNEETLVRREILNAGKSRSFINDTPVPLSLLKVFGDKLLHIHSQHHTINLKDRSFQLELIDAIGGAKAKVKEYQTLFEQHKNSLAIIKNLKEKISENRKSKDYILFQLEELGLLELDKNDYARLSEQLKRVEQQEEIQMALKQISSTIESDNGLYDQLINLGRAIKVDDNNIASLVERINALAIEANDIALSANDELLRLEEYTSENIHELKEKLDAFNAQLFKHNVTSQEELHKVYTAFQNAITEVGDMESQLKDEEKKAAATFEQLGHIAEELSRLRKRAAKEAEQQITETLIALKLKDAVIRFEFQTLDILNKSGKDTVCLLFTSNKGVLPQPVDKAASGGELSRLMLSIQYVLSGLVNLPTVIFDEIDTGVSGEVAEKIGRLLKKMGANMQILAITHLPQVASQGQQHIKVMKENLDDKSYSAFQHLDHPGRIDELAQMMSGEVINDAARQTAIKLLEGN